MLKRDEYLHGYCQKWNMNVKDDRAGTMACWALSRDTVKGSWEFKSCRVMRKNLIACLRE